MSNRPVRLWVDQYGQHYHGRTVKEMQQRLGGKVSKMYRDTADGGAVHVGYVIGKLWLSVYLPMRNAA